MFDDYLSFASNGKMIDVILMRKCAILFLNNFLQFHGKQVDENDWKFDYFNGDFNRDYQSNIHVLNSIHAYDLYYYFDTLAIPSA